ncbi:cytochrome P450 family 96 subfamily A polypeptide 1 [Euphorbia peplus]|nr:cytochrome P450 family 96 subfamily A polypeptide 1 [Euphorbia peplus]
MAILAEYLELVLGTISILFLAHWFRQVISPITNWPVVGMLPGLLYKAQNIHEYSTQLLKQSGGTFEFKGPWFGDMNILFTSNPENVRHIASKNFYNYQKGEQYKKIFEPFGEGVLNSDFETWKSFRRMLQSMLKDDKFQLFLQRSMDEKMNKGLIPVLEHVCSQKTAQVDLQDLFQRFTFDNICLLVLGFDPKSLSLDLPHLSYKQAFDDVEEAVFYRHIVPESVWRLQKWLNVGHEKKLNMAMEIIDSFLEQCISSKKAEIPRRKGEIKKIGENYDLLTACIEETEEDEDLKMSEKYLRDIGFNFIAAGKDTVNAALAWLFWLIATHPSVERKIIAEFKGNLQEDEDGKWILSSLEELNKLVYLHAAICETLRLYPAVPFNHRVSVEEDTLPSGHSVKENTRVMFSMVSMGRMEEIWGNDCNEFKPERWISEKGGIVHIPSHKFIAFNTGPRSCLGKDITFIQMKMITTGILWNYHIKVVENHPVEPCLSVMMHMKHGLKVEVSKRSD